MTIMIGAFVGLHGALCSRSTRSRRSEAENHQELPAGVRVAAEILLAIVSTVRARAALDGLGASQQFALNDRRARGSGRSRARCCCVPRCVVGLRTHFKAIGTGWSSVMCMLWAAAMWDPLPGPAWTGRPLWMLWRARMRDRERVSCRATAGALCVHFVRPSHGQISGAIST